MYMQPNTGPALAAELSPSVGIAPSHNLTITIKLLHIASQLTSSMVALKLGLR